jgi:hypothetical protein
LAGDCHAGTNGTVGRLTNGSTQHPQKPHLVEVWSGLSPEPRGPPGLLSAGAHVQSPAASGVAGSKQIIFWFPPQPPPKTSSSPAPPTEPQVINFVLMSNASSALGGFHCTFGVVEYTCFTQVTCWGLQDDEPPASLSASCQKSADFGESISCVQYPIQYSAAWGVVNAICFCVC